MGGGTAIVEAVASGRLAIGTDLNELAHFITRVKTTPLSKQDHSEVQSWAMQPICGSPHLLSAVPLPAIRNLPVQFQTFFASALETATTLRFPRQRRFARCALLKVGQWALDGKFDLLTVNELCDELRKQVQHMVMGLEEFVSVSKEQGIKKNKITGTRHLLTCSAADSQLPQLLRDLDVRPKLVLTSPPYPGVHMLYHRWQVRGRRETPAPYWIANVRDGHGASYYTMGSRSVLGQKNYFSTLSQVFSNLRPILRPDALVVQLVSFFDSGAQLPTYLFSSNRLLPSKSHAASSPLLRSNIYYGGFLPHLRSIGFPGKDLAEQPTNPLPRKSSRPLWTPIARRRLPDTRASCTTPWPLPGSRIPQP